MLKKLVFVAILCTSTAVYGQINEDFVRNTKFTSLTTEEFKLPAYQLNNYNLRRSSLVPEMTINNLNFVNPGTYDINWMGETYESNFMLMNIPLKTEHHYDINGRLRSSSMSIKLNR